MIIDTSYQDQFPFLFAGNAGTIKITASANERVPIEISYVSVKGSSSPVILYQSTFALTADMSGRIELNFKEILLSMLSILSGFKNEFLGGFIFGVTEREQIWIKFGEGSDAVTHKYRVFAGQLEDEECKRVYDGRKFITVRSQIGVSKTTGTDYVPIVAGDNSNLFFVFYFDIIPPVKYQYPYVLGKGLNSVDMAYPSIRKFADDAGYSEYELKAYDIWAETSLKDDNGAVTSVVKSEVLRFIVSDSKVSIFEFLGSVGLMETIYATGNRKTELTTEPTSFTNGGIECELTNDSRLIHETFTGWLASADEVRFWQEFFSSAKRYAVVDGVSRRIVVDEVNSEGTEGELNAFSFKWHYADKHDDPSMVPIRKELKQYKI